MQILNWKQWVLLRDVSLHHRIHLPQLVPTSTSYHHRQRRRHRTRVAAVRAFIELSAAGKLHRGRAASPRANIRVLVSQRGGRPWCEWVEVKNEDEPRRSLAVRALGCNRIACFVSLTFMVTGRPFATPRCCRRVFEGENNKFVTAWSGHTAGILYEPTGPSCNSPNSMETKSGRGAVCWGESCRKKSFSKEKFGLFPQTNNPKKTYDTRYSTIQYDTIQLHTIYYTIQYYAIYSTVRYYSTPYDTMRCLILHNMTWSDRIQHNTITYHIQYSPICYSTNSTNVRYVIQYDTIQHHTIPYAIYDTVWYDKAQYDVFQLSTIQHAKYNTVRYNTMEYDTIRYNTTWYDIIWHTIQYDMIRYSRTRSNTTQFNTILHMMR